MSNDMRTIKFESLIKDINEALNPKPFNYKNMRLMARVMGEVEITMNTSLAMIFDYDKLNDYGKLIMEHTRLDEESSTENQGKWCQKHTNITAFKDPKYKIEAAKLFVTQCRDERNHKDAYRFIFWSMMVLTVDKTNAAEHLSLICDFARMLKLTDDELEDMLLIIKVLYHEEESDFEFKTKTVRDIFSSVLGLYNN